MVLIQQVELPAPGIKQIQIEARLEGHRFIDTLIEEWANGKNRFDGTGEILCGHLDSGLLVAIGGLNRDPFTADPKVGRIRRVYVRQAWRNKGVGGALVRTLVRVARDGFSAVRLRTDNTEAARFYEHLGFTPTADVDATHLLHLD